MKPACVVALLLALPPAARAQGAPADGTGYYRGGAVVVGAGPTGYYRGEAGPPAPPEVVPALAPYGSWFDDPQYGQLWSPAVGPGFVPYVTNGRWAASPGGRAWSSGYAWGDAPFRYGRWVGRGSRGWCWSPGAAWSGPRGGAARR